MHGWFRKLLKSRESKSPQHELDETNSSVPSVSNVSASPSSASSSCFLSSPPQGTTPPKPPQPQSALSSQPRWSRKYDVLVCHSCVDSDIEEAGRLASFLEASPRSLRCFLRERDDSPGGAVSTELCQAVQESHVWALLITPNFLQDEWCNYTMHQVLTEAPMSNRIIPLIQNLSRSQYPQELKFYFYIDLSRNPQQGYVRLNKTVLNYLVDLVKKENMDSSRNGPSEEGSSNEDKPMSKDDTSDTSLALEVRKKRNESYSDVCCTHQQ